MQLGVMLSCVALDMLERKAATAEAAGYHACQVTFQWDVSPGEAVIAEEICRKRGLSVAACGAYTNLLRPAEATSRGVSIYAAYSLIEAMPQLTARRIVVWSGTYTADERSARPENWTPEAREAARLEADNLATRIRAHAGYLCVEPYYTHVLRTPEEYVAFAREVDPDVVRVVLDPPNLVPPEEYDRFAARLPRIVEALAPMTGLIHLKDIARRPDGSIIRPGPGKGEMDYQRFFTAVREHGITAPAIVEHIDESSVAEMEEARLFVEQFIDTV